MKKDGLLNSHIAKVAADLGHTDMICVADCGLPIPSQANKIDLALDFGVPSFIDVVKMLTKSLEFEEITIAKEIIDNNKELYKYLKNEFSHLKINIITHEQLKEKTKQCKAVLRTGENTPYANIILHSGVVFERNA